MRVAIIILLKVLLLFIYNYEGISSAVEVVGDLELLTYEPILMIPLSSPPPPFMSAVNAMGCLLGCYF